MHLHSNKGDVKFEFMPVSKPHIGSKAEQTCHCRKKFLSPFPAIDHQIPLFV